MNTNTLPKIVAPVHMYNQSYTADGSNGEFMNLIETTVEVLTLNLNAGTMRVRFNDSFQGKKKVVTQDISIEHFYKSFQIKSTI